MTGGALPEREYERERKSKKREGREWRGELKEKDWGGTNKTDRSIIKLFPEQRKNKKIKVKKEECTKKLEFEPTTKSVRHFSKKKKVRKRSREVGGVGQKKMKKKDDH